MKRANYGKSYLLFFRLIQFELKSNVQNTVLKVMDLNN